MTGPGPVTVVNGQPVLDEGHRHQILANRILNLEVEKFNYELSIVEMEEVLKKLDGKSDADEALRTARLGLEATNIRLDAMRAQYAKLFPMQVPPVDEDPK